MQQRHSDRKQYFIEQGITTKKYVIPYIEPSLAIDSSTRVLEIGCAEGGNLIPFIERNCDVVGLDLNVKQVENAKVFLSEQFPDKNYQDKTRLIARDIYDIDASEIGRFDLIFMRDVIEHIHDQEKFLAFVKQFLKPEGKIFFGFPPWQMPFGGHQQICRSFLSKTPWFHLLNKHLYRLVLKTMGESEKKITDLLEIKETGISIERFERIIRTEGYVYDRKTLYLINPNYEIKFGLKPRVQLGLITHIPWLRNFFTTCYYCTISVKE